MERVNFEESSKNREYIRVSEEFKQRVTKDDGSDFERVSRRVTLDEVKENIVLEKKKTIWQDPYVRLSIILTIVSIIYSIIGLISARKIKDIKNLSFEDMELWLMLGLTSLICVCAIFLTCYFY